MADAREGRTVNTGTSIIMKKDVIIIGAGASGLLCAIECGKRGRSVLVIDHAERTGSKIRVSGGGRCNFTNLNITPDHYLSRNLHFCTSALARFAPRDILSLVEKHHIAYYEKEQGQMFCVKSAREIIAALEQECGQAGVEIQLSCRVSDISHAGVFAVATSEGLFSSDSLVIAAGGLSYSKLGASSFGHEVARMFKLRVTQVKPALVPFVFQGRYQKVFKGLAGIAFAAAVSIGKKKFRGNILFTHRGLSGPAALQASLYWEPGEALLIDLLPSLDIEGVFLSTRQSKMELHTLLAGYLPKRFVQTWCGHMAISKPINQCSDQELKTIAKGLHAWNIIPKGTEGYDVAEVTAGGVNTDELSSKTMEAKKIPGLYFIGEVVDVTGLLGGYNLHWAWASGYAAGQFA
jgi:predicted Rossmann fold flavoprotein